MASPDQQLLDIKQQLAALQEKVNYMYDLVRRGQQLEAIKLYRSQTGASLSDAKAAIDGL